MENFQFIRCLDKSIQALVINAERQKCIVGYEACMHVRQYVIKGFDYALEYHDYEDEKHNVNLKNYKYIVFDYANSLSEKTTHVKLIKDDPTQDIYDLLMKLDELLADKQDLVERVNNLRDDLFERDSYIKKLKRDLEWRTIIYDSMQEKYLSLLDKSKEN